MLLMLCIHCLGQETTLDTTSMINAANALVSGDGEREWIFESYDVDMSLTNRCYSGGSFIFDKNGKVTLRNCVDELFVDSVYPWKLSFKPPHHLQLYLQDDAFILNIDADSDREDALWMTLTSVDDGTGRFSEYYELIYAP